MLRELINLFRSSEPLKDLGESFSQMLVQSLDLIRQGGDAYFGHSLSPADRIRLKKQDTDINKLERRIRKKVLIHLAVPGNTMDLPYCLALMSLIKDAERIGDYAKDLADLVALTQTPLPDDEVVAQLSETRTTLEGQIHQTIEVFESADQERAVALIEEGRATADRCEELIREIARSNYSGELTAALVLGARFYQRIGGHMLNLLSSVVMPLHRLDYYKNDDIEKAQARE